MDNSFQELISAVSQREAEVKHILFKMQTAVRVMQSGPDQVNSAIINILKEIENLEKAVLGIKS